jgi:hypothetical protein
MRDYNVSTEFARQSLLVSLHIKQYAGKKEDKKVSRKARADHAADDDAGAFQKNLVPKDALEPITKAVSALRAFHGENTLPWLDEGERVLPSANYESYKTEIEGLKDAFETAVRDFVNNWDGIRAAAKDKLGDMYNESDYPADIRDKFSCTVRFMPLPTAEDFRVNISADEREVLRGQIAASLDDAARLANADLYRRLGEAVKAMAARLAGYDRDPETGKVSGVFRDSLVENLRDLVALVPRLNFSEDPELEAIRAQVEGELCEHDAQVLRDDDGTRERVAESAEAIGARLAEFM